MALLTPMQGKIRVIHIINVRWFNATAWYGLYLANLMKQAGHSVMVLGLGETASFEKAKSFGLNPISLPLNTKNPFAYPSLLHSLSELIVNFQPHIINCHRGENYPIWAYLKAKHDFCLIRTRGDQRLPKNGVINRFLHNCCSDAIIATNSVNAEAVTKRLGTPLSKVHTIIGGVNREIFSFSAEGRKRFREKYNISEDTFTLGVLGRFDHVKGQKELIQAFAKAQNLVPKGKKLTLLLAGFSTEISEAQVHQWIEDAGIHDSAIVTGKCEDVPACISAMDAGVVSSLGSEAIARAALEIMSTGVPLISTTIGVMPDILPAWAMVAPHDIDGLAALISKVATDSDWRTRLQDVCRTKMVMLSGESFLDQTVKVYREVIAEVTKKKNIL